MNENFIKNIRMGIVCAMTLCCIGYSSEVVHETNAAMDSLADVVKNIQSSENVAAVNEQESVAPRTCAIIKPDAVKHGHLGEILRIVEANGFIIERMELRCLSREEAEVFYVAHKDREFFTSLVDFMISGPVVLLVLSHSDVGTDAVKAWRACMGATNPFRAKIGTIRYLFGSTIQQNAVHGSDSSESAEREITLLFPTIN